MLSGSVADMPLYDLAQIQAIGGRTCRITVDAHGVDGELFISQGQVQHARFGEVYGREAAYALLVLGEGRFEVDAGAVTDARTVDQSLEHLVLEAARRADEGSLVRPPPRAPVGSASEADDPGTLFAGEARRSRPSLGLIAGAAAVAAAVALALVGSGGSSSSAGAGVVGGAAGEALSAAEPVDAAELVGPGDLAPRLVSAVPAVMPDVATALAPTVVCRLLVDVDGRVAEAKIYRSRLDLAPFEEAALDAVAGYRFEAGQRAGQPVPSWINWPVSFAAGDVAVRETVRVAGSDTIGGALMPDIAAAFADQVPLARVEITAKGSSHGLAAVIAGKAEIAMASRPVRARELAQARAARIALREHVLGYDGIAVITHPSNPVGALTVDQLATIYRGEARRWTDVGGADLPIVALGRPASSGTHGFFRDKVVRLGDASSKAAFGPAVKVVATSEALVNAVARDPRAVAYVGLGWLDSAVRAVPLSLGAGYEPVAPSRAAVRDGSYSLYRPLLLYTAGDPEGLTASLLGFVTSARGQAAVARHGFVASGAVGAWQPPRAHH